MPTNEITKIAAAIWSEDKDAKPATVEVLAKFFQEQFAEDAMGVADWLEREGTTVDLFIELVDRLRADFAASEVANG